MPLRIFNTLESNEKQNKVDWTPRIDLTGQRFGYLEALEPGAKVNGCTTWVCRCEACGAIKSIKTKELRRGKIKNCGCLRKKRGVEQMHYVEGTCIEILQSSKVRKNNHTGYTGVTFDKKNKKYRADITLQGKRYHLGRFKTLEQAVKARESAKEHLHQAFIDAHTDKQDK